MDCSVLPILRKIQEKGYRVLPALKRKFILKKPFVIENGKGKITFKPSTYLEIFARIDFDHPLIGAQEYTFRYSPLNYLREISFARTFGFKNLLEERKRKGILKGGNLSNAIVLDERGILTEEGLRTPDEFVRHKILDIMGDIYVLGAPLLAKIEALCSGHKLHIEALKTLYQLGLIEEVEERAITFFWLPKKKGQAI
ncbi:MAG: UDP-3-O-acyl-N-acetylglucosamine deacetylase [Thermodesulfobacteriaceae bacterium]|nr:UDP-3-O-acyl-N-acetylglucosamine deacetylase [Thermodesulfobacteriaceae bacterium]